MNENALVVNNHFDVTDERFSIFDYKNLGRVRTMADEKGNPWFCLLDVCNILGLSSVSKVSNRIDDPYLNTIHLGVQTGYYADGVTPVIQEVAMIFINQLGLFQAIGNSRKPEAKKFMHWLLTEVAPCIKDNGFYVMGNSSQMSELEIIAKMVNHMVNMDKTLQSHSKSIEHHEVRLDAVDDRFQEFENVVEIIRSTGYYRVRDFAAITNMPLVLEKAQDIGRIASDLANQRGILIASIPHPEYVTVRMYPFAIIEEAVNIYLNNYSS